MRSRFRCAAVYKAKSLRFVGEREYYAEALALLRAPGDFALVSRGVRRSVVMACPDACGETLTVNLDRRAGKAWRIFGNPQRLSLSPSVWREGGCLAHFIVWQGRILWCMAEKYERPRLEPPLVGAVLSRLPVDRFVHYEELANDADLDPWEVLWACEVLVQERKAISGRNWTFKSSRPRVTAATGR